MPQWEKRALQIGAIVGMGAYPVAMFSFHNRLINFGREAVDYNVPDETIEMVEDELDKLKDLMMKVNTDVAVTDSLNPEWRGGFYFRNGFELLLPVRAVAKDASELPKMNRTIRIRTNSNFSSKTKSIDTATDSGKHIFDGYLLPDAARRFLIRRELHRANNRSFVIVPISIWVVLSGIICLVFVSLMRFGRFFSYSSLVVLAPMAILTFKDSVRRFLSYGEMKLDHDACIGSSEYLEGARQYLNSSIATNLRIRSALGDSQSQFIAANGDRVDDPWPYSKRLKAVEKFAEEQLQKQT